MPVGQEGRGLKSRKKEKKNSCDTEEVWKCFNPLLVSQHPLPREALSHSCMSQQRTSTQCRDGHFVPSFGIWIPPCDVKVGFLLNSQTVPESHTTSPPREEGLGSRERFG